MDELKHHAADFVRQIPERSLSCLVIFDSCELKPPVTHKLQANPPFPNPFEEVKQKERNLSIKP
ncbi:hypothetical protein [Bacteroides gallinarum]|uniref:hypothetical protein n=1 Tax=Bacteroides gallinarum TaxID=376806 RepID=UPI00039E8279|nr:hypothetical protein [Bacteroides gallinarum]